MAKRRMGIIAVMLWVCLCLMPCAAQATSTTDAKEPISPDKDCALTICYSFNGQAFPGQSVNLYQIAEVSADFQYTLTPSFASSGLILNGVQTNSEWNVIRSTLEVHILANNIAPTQTAVTDELGQACFSQLTPGLYLVSGVTAAQEEATCFFDSALVALPGLGADGLWQYQVTVAAKPEILPPAEPDEEIQRKVLKLWKGDENHNSRPENIEVEIFRDGISVETVTLSEDNHWSYTWTAKADDAKWQVVERNIASGYSMTFEQKDTTFILTNAWVGGGIDHPVIPPQTGDSFNILLYITLMSVSGILLILLGIVRKRNRHEETN